MKKGIYKCPPIEELVNKMFSIHMIECYITVKKEDAALYISEGQITITKFSEKATWIIDTTYLLCIDCVYILKIILTFLTHIYMDVILF